ncbi:MAG: class I SAM-dependent DNA methyltransferase [Candidatus Woesearchaeota archaeon]
MKQKSLYTDLAKYYDLIYSWKDYMKESEKLVKLILKYKKSNGNNLLEVGCGTGKHLSYLKNNFSCIGIDLNLGILNIAKKNVKDVSFKKADMINFNLNKKFDIITCLFSSIGYVKTYKNLEKTIKNFSLNLNKGGVLIIEPWFTMAIYKKGLPHMTVYEDDKIKIARLSVSNIKKNVSILDMHYLIAEKNKTVLHFIDRHELGLFEIDKTLKIMEKYNLKAKYLKNGFSKNRGLFICVKI